MIMLMRCEPLAHTIVYRVMHRIADIRGTSMPEKPEWMDEYLEEQEHLA